MKRSECQALVRSGTAAVKVIDSEQNPSKMCSSCVRRVPWQEKLYCLGKWAEPRGRSSHPVLTNPSGGVIFTFKQELVR